MPEFEHEFEDDNDGEVSDRVDADNNPYTEDEAAINDSEDFVNRYGFEHNCRCAEDWAVGNLGVVSVCYLDMCREGMSYLAAVRAELASKEEELAELRIAAADS